MREHELAYRRLNQNQSGDPDKAARALITLAASANPPGRIYLGADSFAAMKRKNEETAAQMQEWRD